jgi:hypothetical protein
MEQAGAAGSAVGARAAIRLKSLFPTAFNSLLRCNRQDGIA